MFLDQLFQHYCTLLHTREACPFNTDALITKMVSNTPKNHATKHIPDVQNHMLSLAPHFESARIPQVAL